MESIKNNDIQMINSDCIQFINRNEIKEDIYIFKSAIDANLVESIFNDNEPSYKKTIAIVNDVNERTFVETFRCLIKVYKRVIFVCDDNNFTIDEVSKIGFRISEIIYQTSENTCNGFVMENTLSAISKSIGDPKEIVIGKKYFLSSSYLEAREESIFLHKNTFIKIFKDPKMFGRICFTRLTNYSFEIVKIKIHSDDESQKKDLELVVTDLNGNIFKINLPAKDKYSLAGFRKNLYPVGNLLDCMSNTDFIQILNQLYLGNTYEVIRIYDRPGLTSDQNAWLWVDEIMSLED